MRTPCRPHHHPQITFEKYRKNNHNRTMVWPEIKETKNKRDQKRPIGKNWVTGLIENRRTKDQDTISAYANTWCTFFDCPQQEANNRSNIMIGQFQGTLHILESLTQNKIYVNCFVYILKPYADVALSFQMFMMWLVQKRNLTIGLDSLVNAKKSQLSLNSWPKHTCVWLVVVKCIDSRLSTDSI